MIDPRRPPSGPDDDHGDGAAPEAGAGTGAGDAPGASAAAPAADPATPAPGGAEAALEAPAGADDLPAAAATSAEHRRWRRLAAAAADAVRLSESLDEGALGETEAVEALASAHGSEPEAFEVARMGLGDRDAARTTVERFREGGKDALTRELDVELDDARIEVARLEARLAAARRRLAELEQRGGGDQEPA